MLIIGLKNCAVFIEKLNGDSEYLHSSSIYFCCIKRPKNSAKMLTVKQEKYYSDRSKQLCI